MIIIFTRDKKIDFPVPPRIFESAVSRGAGNLYVLREKLYDTGVVHTASVIS